MIAERESNDRITMVFGRTAVGRLRGNRGAMLREH